jgi:hypothetical protein
MIPAEKAQHVIEKRDVLLTESREIAYRQLEGVKQSGSLAA